MTKTITRFREVEINVEYPDADVLVKHDKFRQGQADRNNGKPCMYNDGAYLEGWYAPDKIAYYITEDQADAFKL
jgi:hypothetical protein